MLCVSMTWLCAGYIQDLSTLASYMNQFHDDKFLEAISDFNLLLFLAQCEVLPMKAHMQPLLTAVRQQDTSAAVQWSHGEQWSTMTHLLQASG